MSPLLQVNDLRVEFDTYGGTVQAVRGISFSLERGKTLAIVGESGCGKSVTVQSIMGLIPMPPGRITSGTALLDGVDVIAEKKIDGKDIRGRLVGMVFQDPMTSLNPTMTIGDQIAETLQVHQGMSHRKAFARAIELIEMTRIPEAAKRARPVPVRVLGRHAAAFHDRHVAGLRAGDPGCRRAHHRTRRHHSGADPRPHGRSAAREGHGDHPDHPRSRRGGADGRRGAGHVRGRDRREGHRRRRLLPLGAPLHVGPESRHAVQSRRPRLKC